MVRRGLERGGCRGYSRQAGVEQEQVHVLGWPGDEPAGDERCTACDREFGAGGEAEEQPGGLDLQRVERVRVHLSPPCVRRRCR
jgi:hypothetical protein